MNTPSWKLVVAASLTLIYVAVAVWVVRGDRKAQLNGFITLPGMTAFIVTMPVSAPLECWGYKIDFRRNLPMGGAVVGCAILIFAITFGVGSLGEFIFSVIRRSG